MRVDLEALKRANAEFQSTEWRVDRLVEFARRELPAIVAALERAERVESAAKTVVDALSFTALADLRAAVRQPAAGAVLGAGMNTIDRLEELA